MRSTRRSKARRFWAVAEASLSSLLSLSEGVSEVAAAAAAMARKSVVPVSAFQPACLLRISSAREM